MSILDWLQGTPAFAPNELSYLQSQGAMPAGGMLDPRAIRQQAAWGMLADLGGRLAEAGQRRPLMQPGPGVGAAFAGANQSYQRNLQGAAANAALEQQARQQQSYQGLLSGMDPSMRALYETMGPERGSAALATSMQRDNQGFSLSPGQTRFDAQGRPVAAVPQQYAPQVTRDGYIWDPNEYMRYRSQVASSESGNNPTARNQMGSGAAGIYQFTPATWRDMLQRNPDLGQRYTEADITNSQAQEEVFQRFTEQNRTRLGMRLNRDVTPLDLYMAHRFGVDGAAAIARADPNTPIDRALAPFFTGQGNNPAMSRVLEQNPDMVANGQPVTTGQLLDRYRQRFMQGPQQTQQSPPRLPPGIVGQVPQRQAEDNAVVQVMTADGPRWMNRRDAVGQPAVPGQGISVTVPGPNGPTTVQSGPGAGTARPGNMAQPTLNRIEEQIVNNTARLQRVRDVAAAFRPEFLQIGPQIRNWAASAQERLGMQITPEQRQRLEAYTDFRSRAYTELTQTLREMSGAAVTEGEAARLLAAIGDPSRDSPTEFQTKMNNVIRTVSLANARMHYYRRNGLQGALDATPLSDMQGIINRRGDEVANALRAQNLPAEEVQRRVRATLAVEFGFTP